METVEKIYYNGYNINIYQDDWADSPDTYGDDEYGFLVHYHRDCWIVNKAVEKEEIAKWYRGENKSLEREYWIWPVAAYIHSGVVLSLGSGRNFPDYNWDVSHVGAVLIKRKRGLKYEKVYKWAESLIEDWNQYLSGEVYGYDIEDSEDNSVGYGCGGYYGDYEESGLLNDAKSEIDNEIERRCEDAIISHHEQLKMLNSLQPTSVY